MYKISIIVLIVNLILSITYAVDSVVCHIMISRYGLLCIKSKSQISQKSLKIPKGQSETYIEEEQTTQWPKENVQQDKQRSTKHTYKTKDRVTRTPLTTGGELRCSGRVSSSCSTSGTRRVNLITNPVISRE